MSIETAIAILTKNHKNLQHGSPYLDLSEYHSVKTKENALEHIWDDYGLDHNYDCYLAIVEINTTTGETKTLADRNEIMRYLDAKEDEQNQRDRENVIATHGHDWLARSESAEADYKSR